MTDDMYIAMHTTVVCKRTMDILMTDDMYIAMHTTVVCKRTMDMHEYDFPDIFFLKNKQQ
jgi:hypothetical protein